MKKVTVEQFAGELDSLLTEYGDNIGLYVTEACNEVGTLGAKMVAANARAKLGKTRKRLKYPSGWTYTQGYTTGHHGRRTNAAGVIHNRTEYQLSHLLEFGHVTKNGIRTYGRTPAYPHIAEVEQQIITKFENAIKVKI